MKVCLIANCYFSIESSLEEWGAKGFRHWASEIYNKKKVIFHFWSSAGKPSKTIRESWVFIRLWILTINEYLVHLFLFLRPMLNFEIFPSVVKRTEWLGYSRWRLFENEKMLRYQSDKLLINGSCFYPELLTPEGGGSNKSASLW